MRQSGYLTSASTNWYSTLRVPTAGEHARGLWDDYLCGQICSHDCQTQAPQPDCSEGAERQHKHLSLVACVCGHTLAVETSPLEQKHPNFAKTKDFLGCRAHAGPRMIRQQGKLLSASSAKEPLPQCFALVFRDFFTTWEVCIVHNYFP